MPEERQPVLSLVSLGCSKNTVDSEHLLAEMIEAGFLIAEEPADADVVLVNTCGFIDDARQETAEVLEELAELRKAGQVQAIVALGCLVERTRETAGMDDFLSAADARVGFAEYPRLPEICVSLMEGGASSPSAPQPAAGIHAPSPDFVRFLSSPRARTGAVHAAYLKISEGCSNICRFCSIPLIRGTQVSRPIEDLLTEARSLIDSGAREINLIAQDTSRYGLDLYGAFRLPELLRRTKEVDASAWFRLLYAHPRHLSADIIETLASEPHLCRYVDLPLQHIADPVLERMGRGINKAQTLDVLDRIQARMPDGALRTTFIVGYPGETEKDFEELLSFVKEGRFTHAGAFLYSREPGTPAAELADDVPHGEKERRRDALMEAQLEVSRRRLKERIGQTLDVMLDLVFEPDQKGPNGSVAAGRTRLQAPEVDGVVFLKGHKVRRLEPGTIVKARVTEALDYDLVAKTE